MTPRRLWLASVGTLVVINGIAWRRGTDATLCSAVLRPALADVPGGSLILAAGLAALHRHITRPITQGA